RPNGRRRCPVTEPLSDEQAMAQVVEAARQIVRAAGLREVTGGFLFESCNDQGIPPYRGRVEMSFALPHGVEPEAHIETAMAVFGRACGDATRGAAQVCGQCRNMTDHRHDGKTVGVEISEQLSGS